MSSYLNYYIEYKKNDKWNLLYAWVPTSSVDYPEYHDKFSPEKNIALCKVLEDSRQGYIRDTFSSHGWVNTPFTMRGFPKDISEELKLHIELEDLREWEKQKKQLDPNFTYEGFSLKKVPRTEPLSFEKDFNDYRYDKTYATLEEINNFYLKELDKTKKDIEKYHEDKSLNRIEKRLDALEEYIKMSKFVEQDKEKSTTEEYYDVLPELEENLSDVEWLGSWIHGINMIVDFLTCSWNDLEDIRVITYIS